MDGKRRIKVKWIHQNNIGGCWMNNFRFDPSEWASDWMNSVQLKIQCENNCFFFLYFVLLLGYHLPIRIAQYSIWCFEWILWDIIRHLLLFERQQNLYRQNIHIQLENCNSCTALLTWTLFFSHFLNLQFSFMPFPQCRSYNFISFSQFFFDFKQFSVLLIFCIFCFFILHQFPSSRFWCFIVVILSIHLFQTIESVYVIHIYKYIKLYTMIIIKRNDITSWLHFHLW